MATKIGTLSDMQADALKANIAMDLKSSKVWLDEMAKQGKGYAQIVAFWKEACKPYPNSCIPVDEHNAKFTEFMKEFNLDGDRNDINTVAGKINNSHMYFAKDGVVNVHSAWEVSYVLTAVRCPMR